MRNLLRETKLLIKDAHKTPQDIQYIGSEYGEYQCSWDEFEKLADVDYWPEVGSTVVASDLVILFHGELAMHRDIINGIEGWLYAPAVMYYPHFFAVHNPKPIHKLIGESWSTLAHLNSQP